MIQKCLICELEYNARGRVKVSNQPCFLCAARGRQYIAFYKMLKGLMAQVEDVSALMDEGHDSETISEAIRFNLYIMRRMDVNLQYAYQWQGLRLYDIPASTDLRIKTEVFVLENYENYQIHQEEYQPQHRFNNFKEHCYFLFKPARGTYETMDAFLPIAPVKREREEDPLHEFNEMFGSQFTSGGSLEPSIEESIPSGQEPKIKKECVFSIKSL